MRSIALLAAVAAVLAGCSSSRGPLTVDLNGKFIEIHDASTVAVPKGNETQFLLRENRLRVAGQEPIAVVAGSQEHTLYTTDTTINVNNKQIDMAAGERIVITPSGITLPTAGTTPTPAPEPAPAPTTGQ